MLLIQENTNEVTFAQTQEARHTLDIINDTSISPEGAGMCNVSWADIEKVLSEKWEIGAPATTTGTIRTSAAL